ncbi:DNA-binding LacI/PurR family transcriptional regulator [Angulomicrobium tetraedrale]|uniref:DNA-binding LacI/PurR family transcriptional regulator n=1 Tax=Ancylobacter tetraedralis TaxID=217068 RepID=A0A839ZA81_9HYPH|nr:LacI family DNA-binding transcriptional regulator [Ancylobacter tetraedralis]MBB3771639.1 DNA-binding LacI/PurR family transcriptional regulator [Ancylobacter tetraedralis]
MSDAQRDKGRRVTVKDLARDLGMSVSTVSRAFYPDAVVASQTRRLVLERAAALGYRPNPFAQSLITKKTQIVGMVVSDLTNPFYPEVMTEMTAMLQEAGMNVMLAAANQPEKIDDAVDLLLTYQPDLVIVLAANMASHAREKCEGAGAPCIFFNRLSADGLGFGVTCDNEAGGRLVADHLIASGHKHLAYISAFPGASTNVERHRGFCRRAEERGFERPIVIEAGRFSYEAGYAAGLEAERAGRPIDGVFCANDIVAIGFIAGVQESGRLRVPDDLSVVGFDDITMAGWPSHQLTTVAQPLDGMMAATVRLARDLAVDRQKDPHILRLPPGRLIERHTTRRRDGETA